jgi:adenosylcobinamide amidohydrolase
MTDIALQSSPFSEVVRQGRHVIARLLQPARVLSTCAVNGGLQTSLRFLVNHQSCEPVKHQERFEFITSLGPDNYHGHVCRELNLEPSLTAVLGTAAAMQYLGIVSHRWADFEVTAIVSAGVTGNAGSAGDEACYDERDGKWIRTVPLPSKSPGTQSGTINTILLFSAPLSDGALARSAMTMTEGKTSALLELAVGSKGSWRMATGTGTDQYAIACPCEGNQLRTWTGKHTKAGELVGRAVREATLEALRWQNGLEPSYTRSLIHIFGRFGLSEESLKAAMQQRLDERNFAFLKDNWNPVIFEPQLAAASFAFASVLERVLCGTFGASSARESLLNQAALMASGLAAKPDEFALFRAKLIPLFRAFPDAEPTSCIAPSMDLAMDAIALGWRLKWSNN